MSRSKTEYLRVGGVDDGEELKLQGEKVKRAKNFKYLGSTVSSDGRCEEEVRRRIQAGWMSWRKVSGVLCDRKLSAKVKGKMYKSVVRPTILYGMETVAVTERQMGKIEVAQLKMVRWALGVIRKDKIRNEYVRGDRKNCKAGRYILKCNATLVWTCKKERRRLHGEKDDGDGSARQKEKRKAKEKVDGFGERRHGKGWSQGRRRSRSSEMEITVALWRPPVGRNQ